MIGIVIADEAQKLKSNRTMAHRSVADMQQLPVYEDRESFAAYTAAFSVKLQFLAGLMHDIANGFRVPCWTGYGQLSGQEILGESNLLLVKLLL